ncbi:tetratricopeptide repeat protein [Saccharothrix sp. Mg75]|uniref:tetratricopeptide repeat protein n=1 Tax=Saccharothrix sp. Mg75 TaxID=3445357 RepID=UPI003EEE0343
MDSLGYIEHHSGHHTLSVEHYHQALALFRDLGYHFETANTLDGLGHPQTALGHHEQARTVWQGFLRLYRQQGRDDDATRVEQQLDRLDTTQ